MAKAVAAFWNPASLHEVQLNGRQARGEIGKGCRGRWASATWPRTDLPVLTGEVQVAQADQREDRDPEHTFAPFVRLRTMREGTFVRTLPRSVRPYFVASAFASTFVRCLAKCSRAAFAASSVMIHEVFFASVARANVLRRYPRSDFGSQPISFARAFGVYVLSLIRSFLSSWAAVACPCIRSVARRSHVRVRICTDVVRVRACVSTIVHTYDRRSQSLVRSIVRSFDRCLSQVTPPYRPPEGPERYSVPKSRA